MMTLGTSSRPGPDSDDARSARPGLDPVTLGVISAGLSQVATEMDIVHERTAFSPVISEAFDRSSGLYDRRAGALIAQGGLALPLFIGVMQESVAAVAADDLELGLGDVVVLNDPYAGGTHLMDVKMIKGFFHEGELWCYLANTGHWPDMGGVVPGGYTSTSTEVQQEGLRLPPVKLVSAGELNEDVLRIVLANIRIPEERIGDIKAQLSALTIGERRLRDLIAKHGAAVVRTAIDELGWRAAEQLRHEIRRIPNGVYRSAATVDSDGVVNEPLRIVLAMTVRGDEIEFDFSDSSPPCRGPLNCVWATTLAAVYVAVKHIFPEVPINAGCFEPLHVKRPVGTFLHAEYPRPVAGCASEVSQRIIEAVFGAMAQAIPHLLFAAPAGTSGNLSLGGVDPATGRRYVMYFFSGGGFGGWNGGDGLTNGCPAIGISKTQPLEVIEGRYPVLFDRYALRRGSAGTGRFRGGFGVDYRISLRRGSAVASFLMDHGREGPAGVLGGERGAPNEIRVGRNGVMASPEHISKGEGIELGAGDWIEVRTPGGGGYGPASERSRERRDTDAQREYFT